MAEPTPTPPKPARLIRIVLVVSLSLNLAVAGILIGAASSGRWKGGPPPNFEVALGPITRALAPEERRDIRRSLIQDRALRDLNLRSGMAEVIAALQADPFEIARLEDLMDEQIGRMATMQGKVKGALLDVVAEMTPERRMRFAQELTEEMSKVRPERNRPSGG